PGTHRVLRVITDGNDGRCVFGHRVVEQAVGFGQTELHGAFSGGDDLVEHGEVRRRGLRVIGIVDALEGEDDVVGGDGAAVGELDALLQGARPHGGIVVGFEGLGQQRHDLRVVVPAVECVVEVDGAAD